MDKFITEMSGLISNSLVVGLVPQEHTTVKEQVYHVNTITNNTSTSLNKTPESSCTLSFRCRLLCLRNLRRSRRLETASWREETVLSSDPNPTVRNSLRAQELQRMYGL